MAIRKHDAVKDKLNEKKIFILGDSIVKHVKGRVLSVKLEHQKNVYVRSFPDAKVKYYVKPCIRDDNAEQIILHVETNDLNSEKNSEGIQKSIRDLAKEGYHFKNYPKQC